MSNIKEKLFLFKNNVRLYISFLKECLHFYRLTVKYNASVSTDNDLEKMQYTLLRENHTIEKGLSMKEPRKGFGRQKVHNLLIRLDKYVTLYYKKDKRFLDYPLSTIAHYIEYTKKSGVDIPQIEQQFQNLLLRLDNHQFNQIQSGVVNETKEHIMKVCDLNFESLLYSRHSLRYFTNEIVSHDVIDKALVLAQRTPSACNRQGWKSHIFLGDNCHRLLEWQGGCRGFEHEIHGACLVTANLKAFLAYEVHQAYVDGGLYAMNLINAFHSLGIGTIPLSTGFYCHKLDLLRNFGIPENEVPIAIIGFGYYCDEFKIAESTRKDIKKTNTYH